MEKSKLNYESFLAELKRRKGRARLDQLAKKLGTGKQDLRRMLLGTPHPELRQDEDWVELLQSSSIHIATRCELELQRKLWAQRKAKRFYCEQSFSKLAFISDYRLDQALKNVMSPCHNRASNAHTRKALDEAFDVALAKRAVLVSDDGNLIVFSSGLYNNYGQPLFVICRKQKGLPKPYLFMGFYSDGSSRLSSIQVRAFCELPQQTEQSELSVEFQEMFCVNGRGISLPRELSSVAVDYTHIASRLDRFPRGFLETIFDRNFEFQRDERNSETMKPKDVAVIRSLSFPCNVRQKAYEAITSEMVKSLQEIALGKLSPLWFPYGETQQGAFLVPMFENSRNGAPVYLVIIAYDTGRLHAKTVYSKSIVHFDCGAFFAA